MISRARHGMAVLMAVGCLVGLSPLAACAQEEYKPPVAKEKSTTQKSPVQKSPSQKGTKVAQASAKEKAKEKEKAKKAAPTEKVHKISIQVAENNPQLMNLALNNASNIISHYKKLGEKAVVEIVTFGPGLTMLRDDTSPVKARIQTMSLENPELTFAACANTQTNMSKQESKDIPIMSEAKITPSGVVRLAELQSQGYAYIRP